MEYSIFVQMKCIKHQLQTAKLLCAEICVIECKNKHEMEWKDAHTDAATKSWVKTISMRFVISLNFVTGQQRLTSFCLIKMVPAWLFLH